MSIVKDNQIKADLIKSMITYVKWTHHLTDKELLSRWNMSKKSYISLLNGDIDRVRVGNIILFNSDTTISIIGL